MQTSALRLVTLFPAFPATGSPGPDIHPLAVPLWLGAEHPGAEKGARLLADELAERWRRPDRQHLSSRLQPIEIVDTAVPHDADLRLHKQSLEFLPEVEITSREVADRVAATIRSGQLPLTLGGDHAIAIGTIAGAARACTKLGVIWFDTHPDINTPSTSPSGHIHGIAAGGWPSVKRVDELPTLTALVDRVPMVAPENVCMLGIRDIDPAEAKRIREMGIWALSMDEWSDLGIMEGVRACLQHLRATQGGRYPHLVRCRRARPDDHAGHRYSLARGPDRAGSITRVT
jgi:arginase